MKLISQRVKAIREAVGFDIKLRLDANQAWTPKDAVKAIQELADYQIELVEQPVKKTRFRRSKNTLLHKLIRQLWLMKAVLMLKMRWN